MKTQLKYYFPTLLVFILGCSTQNKTIEGLKESISKTADNFWIKSPSTEIAFDKTAELNLNTDQVETFDTDSKKNTSVELMWLVPEGRVTKYLLRFGTEINNLDSIIEISSKSLSSVMHPKFGKVYKYILVGVPEKTKIYYSLQAGNELGMSEPTPVASEDSKY